MNLLPEGVTATAEELVNSVKGHLEIIDQLESLPLGNVSRLDQKQYCADMRGDVFTEYMKLFKFRQFPPKPATEANPAPQNHQGHTS